MRLCALMPAMLAAQSSDLAALRAELAVLVDLPTAAQRADAADRLAQRPGIELSQWVEACRGFAPADPLPAGAHALQADLQVLDRAEPTDLHVYVPAELPRDRPAPLLLWGHGAGGSGEHQYQLWRDLADRLGMVVLAPTEAGTEPGWGFTLRERRAQLAALRWARRRVDVDENAVFVGGVSRGGHMAWELLLRHPDQFAGAAPCIGGPRLQLGEQNNLRYLENAAHLPIRDLQGSQDDPLLLANLRLCFARLGKLGSADQQLIEFPDRGHDFDLAAVEWPQFLGARRQPERERVVRMAARADEARSAWIEITGFDAGVAETFELRVGSRWDRLDDAGKRALVLDEAIRRTARLEVVRTAPGRFTVRERAVKRLRLLLSEPMLAADGSVAVKWGGHTHRSRPEASAVVLLREFAERFDRTFLPVVAVDVP